MNEKITHYRDAIAYVRRMQTTAAEIRTACAEELTMMRSSLDKLFKFYREYQKSKYIGDATCKNVRLRTLEEYINSERPLPRLFADFITETAHAEEEIKQKESRYGDDDGDTPDKRIVNLCTMLYVAAMYFGENEGARYFHAEAAVKAGYQDRLQRLYRETAEAVKAYTVPGGTCTAVKIQPVDEAFAMPKDFPAAACLPFGHYLQDKEQDFSSAVSLIDRDTEELNFKQLIHKIAACHRTRDALTLDLESAAANTHLLIHQPHYHIRENDDRPGAQNDLALIDLLETTMLRYLNLFPRISKRVCLLQSRDLSDLSAFTNNLHRRAPDLVLTAENKSGEHVSASHAELLDMLLADCRAAKELITAPWKSLYEYNLKNYDKGIWKQMTLLVIKDFPVGFDARAIERLTYILQEGHKFGVTVIMSVCDDLMAKTDADRHIDYRGVLSYFTPENEYYSADYSLISKYDYSRVSFREQCIRRESFYLEQYLNELEHRFSILRDPAIPLLSMLEDTTDPKKCADRRKNFSRVLDIPIGKAGTANTSIRLYRTGAGSPHMVIAGTTGSGKSVLLQDIIISAACHYAPDELEMYLFDLKESPKGFERFSTGFPQVKKIAAKFKERDVLELLRMIRSIYTSRIRLVSEAGYSDIGGYNADADKRGVRKIPRMLVVIDEYQSITSNDSISLLQEIAQKGREYGVVLIMASQSSSNSSFNSLIRLFGHRFEFKNEPLGNFINKITNRANELNGPKGLCFYSSDGSNGNPLLVRCAYVSDEDSREVLAPFTDCIQRAFGSEPDASAYTIGSVQRILRPVDYRPGAGFSTFADMTSPLPSTATPIFEDERTAEAEHLRAAAVKYTGDGDISDRGFLLRLGLNSISLAGMDYKLDRRSPYLLLCGGMKRLNSMQYTIARAALMAAERADTPAANPLVYYLDGDPQSGMSAPIYALKGKCDRIRFSEPTPEGLNKALDDILTEAKRRRATTDAAAYAPMLIMLSPLDGLLALGDAPASAPARAASGSLFGSRLGQNRDAKSSPLGSILGGKPASAAPAPASPATTGDAPAAVKHQLEELFTLNLYRSDIFLCIQLGDASYTSFLKKLLNEKSFSSFIFLEKCASDGKETEADRQEMLSALEGFAGALLPHRNKKISRDDLYTAYAYRMSNEETIEFIPYEYFD